MAHSPASRPDPFEPQNPDHPFPSHTDPAEDVLSGRSLSHYLNALSASGGGSLSAEVALDLVLNEIAERACHTTKASGAAIALARDGEMVCRATTGENAPDIGARLSTSHGLSGACVRTGEWQLCNDTENDSRVDAEVCRRLGVRSILVLPVQRTQELIGVVEIFSTQPKAFSDRDIQILQTFVREVSENVGLVAELQVQKPEPRLVADFPDLQNFESAIDATEIGSSESKPPQRDFSTSALLVCVILLALILGWMLGHAEWQRPILKSVAPAIQPAQGQSSEVSISDSTTVAATVPRSENSPARRSGSSAAEDVPVDDGLVVSRNGKVIFRSPSPPTNDLAAETIPPAPEKRTIRTPRLRLSPEIAKEYLATKVEPEYPEEARSHRIQGSVVLDAWVDKDGAVRNVIPISGNPQLLTAATRAVTQWRFHPFFHEGQPEEFTTRITVAFRAP
jgi:L-methionine (R)-S-oxide reductase